MEAGNSGSDIEPIAELLVVHGSDKLSQLSQIPSRAIHRKGKVALARENKNGSRCSGVIDRAQAAEQQRKKPCNHMSFHFKEA